MQIATKKSGLLLIVALVACYAMVFIAESGIAVTLPMIQQSLGLTSHALHWVINSYLLTLSVLLLLGGKLADIYTQRSVFSTGIIIFTVGAILSACAQDETMLISGQCLQGVGASLLIPCITVMIRRNFPEQSFGKIFGLVLGFSNFFYAVGPFIGGAITEFAGWHWFFWVNVPIGLICLFFIHLSVEKETAVKKRAVSLDIKGLVVFILTLTALVFAIMQAPEWGWGSAKVMGLFVFTAAGLWLFVRTELRAKEPLLDMRLFLNKAFFAGNITLFCSCFCLTLLVFLALWLRFSVGFSPATVGIALLPATLTFIFMPTLTGIWESKVGPRAPLLTGTTLIVIGVAWMVVMASLQHYYWLFVGLFVFGLGIPLAIPTSIMTVMGAVKPEQGGMASGTFSTVRQLAFTIGIAVLGVIIASYNDSHVLQAINSHAEYANITSNQVSLLLAGKDTIVGIDATQLSSLKQMAGDIYTQAFIYAMAVVALLAVLACITTFIFIRKRK